MNSPDAPSVISAILTAVAAIPGGRMDVAPAKPRATTRRGNCLRADESHHQLGGAGGRDDHVGADGLQGRLHVGGGGEGALLREADRAGHLVGRVGVVVVVPTKLKVPLKALSKVIDCSSSVPASTLPASEKRSASMS